MTPKNVCNKFIKQKQNKMRYSQTGEYTIFLYNIDWPEPIWPLSTELRTI